MCKEILLMIIIAYILNNTRRREKPSWMNRKEFKVYDFVAARKGSEWELKLLRMISSPKGVVLSLMICNVLAIVYGLVSLDWIGNLLNISIALFLFVANRSSLANILNNEDTTKTMDWHILLGRVVSATIRYFLFKSNKILFIPAVIIWLLFENKWYLQSTVLGLIPTLYFTTLFVSCGIYTGIVDYITNGLTVDMITSLCESFGLAASFWILTYSLVNVTGYLSMKVEKLEQTRTKLEEALTVRNTFLSHVSHEFRCPIMSSRGCLELLKETKLNSSQTELVDMALSSNNVLLLLIEDILQIIRIENETNQEKIDHEIKKESFELEKCLFDLQNIISGYAKQFEINLNFICDSLSHTIVKSNRSYIYQILSNLLTNSIKASKPKSNVTLTATILEKNEKSAKIEFKISDKGKGIPKELISKIFEPFVQLDNNNESKVPSSGLGLTTVSILLNHMKGTINVDSTVGVGSDFTVTIPFELADFVDNESVTVERIVESQLTIHEEHLRLSSAASSSKQSENEIILAEDNPVNRKILLKMLSTLGYAADSVSDGRELLDNYKNHKIVFTDMVCFITNI